MFTCRNNRCKLEANILIALLSSMHYCFFHYREFLTRSFSNSVAKYSVFLLLVMIAVVCTMPKSKLSRGSLLHEWILINNSFSTDGKVIYCNACQKQVPAKNVLTWCNIDNQQLILQMLL